MQDQQIAQLLDFPTIQINYDRIRTDGINKLMKQEDQSLREHLPVA